MESEIDERGNSSVVVLRSRGRERDGKTGDIKFSFNHHRNRIAVIINHSSLL